MYITFSYLKQWRNCFHSHSHSLSGNHLTSTRRLVGQTVNSQAIATDAIHAVVMYDVTVSHWHSCRHY